MIAALAAICAVLTPVLAFVNLAAESKWRKQHPPNLLGGVLYITLTLAATGFCALLAYVFFRYALHGRTAATTDSE
jgi:predicted permease